LLSVEMANLFLNGPTNGEDKITIFCDCQNAIRVRVVTANNISNSKIVLRR